MLARLGRYREARATIADATRDAEASGDAVKLGGSQLLAALLSIERDEYARAIDESRHAQMALATLPAERGRFSMTLLELISGIAEIGSGRPRAAASHVESLRRLSRPQPDGDEWQLSALQGELAFAAGDLDGASEMFARAEPARKQFFSRLVEGSVLANDLLFRDGLARVAKARGDRRRAIAVYRNLLTYGPDQNWVAVFEPRYVLEIARLYELEGDKPSARREYERFMQFWKKADEDLAELVEVRTALTRLRE
jgi:tetratricopeptide (TPR) repeat protein